MAADSSYYLIHYRDPKDGKISALKAKRIEDSSLGLGFVRISEFLFDTSGIVVQPTEVQLEARFEGVKSLHLSIYSIVSVEEMGGSGGGKPLKFKKSRSNLLAFPTDSPHK
jgi:hypothetical protein